jgi:hypothetical protein
MKKGYGQKVEREVRVFRNNDEKVCETGGDKV